MKIKFYSFMAVAASFVLLASCSSKKKSVAKDVLNGGFENCENGAITNWTKTGTAFSARGIVSSEEVNGTKVEKDADLGKVEDKIVQK